MKSGEIGSLVTSKAGSVVVAVIVLTLIFGYFATQMEMTTDYKSFMPDDEVSRAYNEITEDYYSTEMVQILVKYDGGNALSRDALIQELELEKELADDQLIHDNLQTPSDPSRSIYSVAELVISTDMISSAAIEMMNLCGDTGKAAPYEVKTEDYGRFPVAALIRCVGWRRTARSCASCVARITRL